MRQPVTLTLLSRLVIDAELYAPGRKGADAVEWILSDYPRLVAELRQARRQLDDFNAESAELDQLVDQLKTICRRVLDL